MRHDGPDAAFLRGSVRQPWWQANTPWPRTAARSSLAPSTILTMPILFIIFVLLLIGAYPRWPHSRNWGYYPSGGFGLVLLILVVLMLTNRV